MYRLRLCLRYFISFLFLLTYVIVLLYCIDCLHCCDQMLRARQKTLEETNCVGAAIYCCILFYFEMNLTESRREFCEVTDDKKLR